MTAHKDIQNPDDFNDQDYKRWDYLLFDEQTDQEQLKEIVMTLAHLPTQGAQELLHKFSQSPRAREVEWLDCAIDEGHYLLLCPDNETEDRDLKALKLMFQMDDRIIEQMGTVEECNFRIDMKKIELKAMEKLLSGDFSENELDEIKLRMVVLHDLLIMDESQLNQAEMTIRIDERIRDQIEDNITTKRYKQMDKSDLEGLHFHGDDSPF